jgi:O-antigen ligase
MADATGLLAVSLGVLWHSIAQASNRIEIWVFLLLVVKPWIDLTWNLPAGEIFNQQLNVQTFVALAALLMTAIILVRGRVNVTRSKLIVAFLAWALLAAVITPSGWGINELVRLYSGAAFFFTAGLVLNTHEKMAKFVRYFLLVLLVPVCLCFLQAMGIVPYFYWDWLENQELGRASGMYNTPLDLIRFLIFAVPLALWLRMRSASGSINWLVSTAFLVLAVPATALTYHRAGWVVLAFEVMLWLALTGRVRSVPIIAAVILVAGLVFADRLQVLFEPVMPMVRGEASIDSGEFLRGRGATWFVFMNSLFSSNPALWFIGKGGSVAEGADAYGTEFVDFAPNEPHNDFLRILHAYGFVGLGLYLAILHRFFRAARRLRQAAAKTFDHDVGTLLLVVTIAIVLMSITTEPMRYPACVWYFFALASVAFCRLREAGCRTAERARVCEARP